MILTKMILMKMMTTIMVMKTKSMRVVMTVNMEDLPKKRKI